MTRAAGVALLFAVRAMAVGADELAYARDLARSGPIGVRVLAVRARSSDPATREEAARALAFASGPLARSILAGMLTDPDPATRGAAVESLVSPRPRREGTRWIHDGAVVLARALEKLDAPARARLEPALQLAATRYVLAGLQRLREEAEGIYFEQMFDPIGALRPIGERYLSEAFLRVVGQLDLGESPLPRHALADMAGKAIGDLRLASARPWLLEIHDELVQRMRFGSRNSPLEDVVYATEIALYKLGYQRVALARIDRLKIESRFQSRARDELASYYMRMGLYGEAIAIYEQNIRDANRFGSIEISNYNLACALSKSGQVDRGLQHLRRAIEGGYRNFDGIARDRDLDNLRADPRYAALIAELRVQRK